jgi:predicted phage baseplate assembly protein
MTTYESLRGRIVPPDLDDRTWQDLVAQMKALIPHYAPQWTDQNPSDLGITLLEMVAWLAEGMIYRINRTPEKNYIAFLNLLGITRDPATPARTYLTFAGAAAPATIAKGTQAQTASREGRPVVFETDEDVLVQPTELTRAVVVGPYPSGAAAATYSDRTGILVGPSAAKYLVDVAAGQSVRLCFGFTSAIADEVRLGVRLFRALATSDAATLSWTYSQGAVEPLVWPTVPGVGDGTAGLLHDGRVGLTVPQNWTAQRAAGPAATNPWTTVTPATASDEVRDPLFWVALAIANTGQMPIAVGFDRLLFNAASAHSALTPRAPEDLGVSTGAPLQVFSLANAPLFKEQGLGQPFGHLQIQVGEGTPSTWKDWSVVDELPPGAGNVYKLNPVSSEIQFGNHDPSSLKGNGSIPPPGSRIRVRTYRYVGAGAAANAAADTVTTLGTTLAGAQVTGVARVSNLGPARDGADEEPIEDTLLRAPQELKIRDRAVTADDYEFLIGEAAADIVVARCLAPRLQAADGPGPAPLPWLKGDPWTFAGISRAPGNVSVIIVPDQGSTVARPEPTPDQLRQVRAYLEPRRDVTAHLDVLGPRYLPVIVNVELLIWQQAIDAGASLSDIRKETLARIKAFLHPAEGGPSGTGWQVGQPVFSSDLFRAIMPAEDTGYISTLQMRPDIPAYHYPPLNAAGTSANYDPARERPIPLSGFSASVRLADYELVCAADDASHVIKTTVAPL